MSEQPSPAAIGGPNLFKFGRQKSIDLSSVAAGSHVAIGKHPSFHQVGHSASSITLIEAVSPFPPLAGPRAGMTGSWGYPRYTIATSQRSYDAPYLAMIASSWTKPSFS